MEKFKYICEKLDLRKIRKHKSATWNIYWQFGINLDDPVVEPYNYQDFYMEEELQDEFMREYLKKAKSGFYKLFKYPEKKASWEWLNFPIGAVPNIYKKEI